MARRRSNVSDFLTNFNAAFDTTSRVGEALDHSRVARAQALGGQQYDDETAQLMHNVANARDEQGNPYYQLTPAEGGGYGLNLRGEDGSYAPVAGAGFEPARYTEFMGQRHEGELTRDQVDGLRAQAFADVASKYDPERGLRMRRDIKRDERDDLRFGWEQADAQGKQKERERSEMVRGVYDHAMNMSDEQLLETAGTMGQALQRAGVPLIYQGVTRDGFAFTSLDPKTGDAGPAFHLNPVQMRQVAVAGLLGQAGLGPEAMAILQSADEGMAKLVTAWNSTLQGSVNSQRQATQGQTGLDMSRAKLAQSAYQFNANQAAQDRRRREDWVREALKESRVAAGRGLGQVPKRGEVHRTIDPETGEVVVMETDGFGGFRPLGSAPRPQDMKPLDEAGARFRDSRSNEVYELNEDGSYTPLREIMQRRVEDAMLKAKVPEEIIPQMVISNDGRSVSVLIDGKPMVADIADRNGVLDKKAMDTLVKAVQKDRNKTARGQEAVDALYKPPMHPDNQLTLGDAQRGLNPQVRGSLEYLRQQQDLGW